MDSAIQELGDLRQQVLERAGWVESLDVSCRDVAAVDVLDELESLKNTIAAVQARLAVSLKQARVAQRAHQPAPLRERGIGAEVALARRESPHRGGTHLGLAVVLVSELPHTLAAMEAGWCSEWRAIQIAQGTACLSRADREQIDARLMADPDTTHGWGDRQFRAEVDKLAYAADPAAAVARHAQAVADRHTSLRPAPDGMARFSALVPLAEGVAVYAALSRAADTARAAGDQRTRGQVMADTFLGAFLQTGHIDQPVVPVAVQVTVSDATLLNLPGQAGDQPGWISSPGVAGVPLPADLVRDLVARAHDAGLASLRRLYTSPGTGQLVAMDSTARTFPAGLARFLEARDRTCRTPWCDAPVRHRDHIRSWVEGGATTADNGQGVCEGCNHDKQADGWHARTITERGAPHEVETTTPTGHRHHSRAPGLPPPLDHASLIEIRLADHLAKRTA
jgi:hypothetical protein